MKASRCNWNGLPSKKADHGCKKAINAFKEVLKVFNEETYPEKYKTVVENLNNAHKFCK